MKVLAIVLIASLVTAQDVSWIADHPGFELTEGRSLELSHTLVPLPSPQLEKPVFELSRVPVEEIEHGLNTFIQPRPQWMNIEHPVESFQNAPYGSNEFGASSVPELFRVGVPNQRPISIIENMPFDIKLSPNNIPNDIQPFEFHDNQHHNMHLHPHFENQDTIRGIESDLVIAFDGLNTPLEAFGSSFSCAGLPYGYYADVENFCKLYHICVPMRFLAGTIQVYQYKFMCGEETVFDQSTMTCVRESNAMPCQDAPRFYAKNTEFGLPHEKETIES